MSPTVERRARAAVAATALRLAVALRGSLPGVRVAAEGDRVVLTGRGLARRLDVPALRWPAGLLR